MKFQVTGSKSSPRHSKISEIDLLTDSMKSIRARQRLITALTVRSWMNASLPESGRKYSKAIITISNIHSN